MYRHRMAMEQQDTAMMLMREAIGRSDPPMWNGALCTTAIYFPDRRRRDTDNVFAALKSSRDASEKVGIIKNDSGLAHSIPLPRIDRDNPRVEMTFTPIDKEAMR